MSGPQGSGGVQIEELDFTGTTVDAFADVNAISNAIRAFMVVKNVDGANALQWQVVGKAISTGNEVVIYGPVSVPFGDSDFANVDAGPYSELKVQVKSDAAGLPADYEAQESVLAL